MRAVRGMGLVTVELMSFDDEMGLIETRGAVGKLRSCIILFPAQVASPF